MLKKKTTKNSNEKTIKELSLLYPGSNIPWNNSCTVTYFPSLKLFKLGEQDIQDTAGEARTS